MLAKKRLLSAIAGLAILALPMTALASDHHRHWDAGVFARPVVIANQPRANFWRADRVSSIAALTMLSIPTTVGIMASTADRTGIRNSYPAWNPPPTSSYVPPPREYAYAPPMPQQFFGPSSNYPDYGYGDGYAPENGYGYGGNQMTVRDRLLRERAGAYQQLAIRERVGDRNGAHHLWNTIHSLNRQLARLQ